MMQFALCSVVVFLAVLEPERVSASYSRSRDINVAAREAIVADLGQVKVQQIPQGTVNVTVAGTTNSTDDEAKFNPSFLTWIEDQGGFVHGKLEFRYWDTRVFASEFIPKGTILLVIPESALISPNQVNYEGEEEDRECNRQQVAGKLYEELQLGPSSKYAPYLESIVSRGAKPAKDRLPTALWSNAGKEILEQLLVREDSSDDEEEEFWGMDIGLPPQSFQEGSLHDLLDETCGKPRSLMSDNELHAFLLHHRFSWGHNEYLIPIYDMLEHRSGASINTVFERVVQDQTIVLKSSRAIVKGEELFGSHYQHVAEDYGTPELFRDHGFVEEYPQRFIFHETDVAFELSQIQVEGDHNTITTEYQVKWLSQRPYNEDMEFLVKQYERLTYFFFEMRHAEMKELPDIEQALLRQYHGALVSAIGAAIDAYEDESTCILSTGSCYEYDLLLKTPDTLDYRNHTCGANLGFEGYNEVDSFNTPYQEVTFFYNPELRDTCFDLDQTVQICDSYRPAYHEPAVEYPARYLDKLERALFVGGGDSMLLHELLKYKSIRKVVGLELDQKVTRYSFKHFGTQPHWDNEKVEWWYGDATKSLNMLPKDYFGSFDLVIVDLSETVMSFRVTNRLDIFGALALLLNPKGILVKNEVYLERFSDMFDYSMQAVVYNAPVVCNQIMVFGSYGTDFLEKKPKDVEVDTLLLRDNDDMKSPYGLWHDYRKNTTRIHPSCVNRERTPQATVEDQKHSPGIVMIVDVEDAPNVAVSPNGLNRILTKTLTKLGLSVVSGMATPLEDDEGGMTTMVSLVMEEGYIMGRAWPTKHYCALDIHLWGSFDKHDQIRQALILALGGNPKASTSSAFRIVAGGMYGVNYWQEDTHNRGPPMKRNCKSPTQSPENQQAVASLPDAALTVLSETLSLLNKLDATVAVFCGTEEEPCDSLEVVSSSLYVPKTTLAWACPDLDTFDMETGFGAESMQKCQKQVLQLLNHVTTNANSSLSAIILDSSVPYAMGQVLAKIFSDESMKQEHLDTKDFMIVTAFLPNETNTWRQALVDRFRRDILVHDPVFRTEVLFHSKKRDSILELGITRSGDAEFIPKLKGALSMIEYQTDFVADVQTIQGGQFRYQDEEVYNPTIFHSSDYDTTSPLEQWMSQKSMGFQTIFQIEPKHWTEYTRVGDRIEVFFENEGFWDPGYVMKIHPGEDPLFDVALDDGTFESRVHPNYLRALAFPGITAAEVDKALVYALDSIVEKQTTKMLI